MKSIQDAHCSMVPEKKKVRKTEYFLGISLFPVTHLTRWKKKRKDMEKTKRRTFHEERDWCAQRRKRHVYKIVQERRNAQSHRYAQSCTRESNRAFSVLHVVRRGEELDRIEETSISESHPVPWSPPDFRIDNSSSAPKRSSPRSYRATSCILHTDMPTSLTHPSPSSSPSTLTFHYELMCARHQLQTVRVIECLGYVLSERVASATWRDAPTAAIIWIRPRRTNSTISDTLACLFSP